VLEVEDGGSGDGGVWVQIQVAVVSGMLQFGVAGVGVLVTDLLHFSVVLQIWFLRLLVFCGGEVLRW
jgi:hypothetical protein